MTDKTKQMALVALSLGIADDLCGGALKPYDALSVAKFTLGDVIRRTARPELGALGALQIFDIVVKDLRETLIDYYKSLEEKERASH